MQSASMSHDRMQYDLLSFTAVPGWSELTSDEEDWPFTLTRDDGIEALQFTFAFYESGVVPNVFAFFCRNS